jgi:hypothetical protein
MIASSPIITTPAMTMPVIKSWMNVMCQSCLGSLWNGRYPPQCCLKHLFLLQFSLAVTYSQEWRDEYLGGASAGAG